MCQKTNLTKRFFVLLHQPFPLQKVLVLGVAKHTPHSEALFDQSRNTFFLTPSEIQLLGIKPHCTYREAYMVPIEIPRDWFLH